MRFEASLSERAVKSVSGAAGADAARLAAISACEAAAAITTNSRRFNDPMVVSSIRCCSGSRRAQAKLNEAKKRVAGTIEYEHQANTRVRRNLSALGWGVPRCSDPGARVPSISRSRTALLPGCRMPGADRSGAARTGAELAAIDQRDVDRRADAGRRIRRCFLGGTAIAFVAGCGAGVYVFSVDLPGRVLFAAWLPVPRRHAGAAAGRPRGHAIARAR